ncbi:MAG: hypothetical protein JRN62_03125 [Nitrososphaerota archaeon]|jgi:hypothetical protein|nr:hypothetical protein [Nitrososphaerota archaeon]MDG6948986.1 hypothetical protein [Nitrososphaerota archaeon]
MDRKELTAMVRNAQCDEYFGALQRLGWARPRLYTMVEDFLKRSLQRPDRDIILEYLACRRCGRLHHSLADALLAAEQATTMAEWFTNLRTGNHR